MTTLAPAVGVARDTRSDSAKALLAAEDLLAAGAAMFIGPDTTDVAVQLRSLFDQQTLIMPSYRQGQEVEYLGLSGPLQFDQFGEAPEANTSWWTIENDQFVDIPAQSNCQ